MEHDEISRWASDDDDDALNALDSLLHDMVESGVEERHNDEIFES